MDLNTSLASAATIHAAGLMQVHRNMGPVAGVHLAYIRADLLCPRAEIGSDK